MADFPFGRGGAASLPLAGGRGFGSGGPASPPRRWGLASSGLGATPPGQSTGGEVSSIAFGGMSGASTSASAVDAAASVAGAQTASKDAPQVFQLQQDVAGLGARCAEVESLLEQLRERFEERLEQFATAAFGGGGGGSLRGSPATAASASSLAGSPGAGVSAADSASSPGSAADPFRIHIGSPKDSRRNSSGSASLDQRLRFLERALGEAAGGAGAGAGGGGGGGGGSAFALGIGGASPTPSRKGRSSSLESGGRGGFVQAGALRARVAYIETVLGDSSEKSAQEREALVAARSSPLCRSPKVPEKEHTSVRDRLDFVEGVMGDSLEKSKRDLAAAHVKLDLFAVRVTSCETNREQLHALKEAHESLTNEHTERHASVMQRIDYLEKLIGDSADQHAKELAKHKSAHAETVASHAKLVDHCRERMDRIDKAIDDTIEKHANEIKKVQVAHSQLSSDIDRHGKKQGRMDQSHSSIGERMAELERKVSELQAGRQKDAVKSFLT